MKFLRKPLALLMSALLALALVPAVAVADDDTNSGSQDYPYLSGFTQVDGIYAFDAATYPYGDYTTCGGYDYDTGAWVGDTPTVTEKGVQLQLEARGTFVSGNMSDPDVTPVIEDNIVMDGTEITWSVDDSSVATIDFQSGLLTPVANGTVNVTATTSSATTYGGASYSITFPVVIDIKEEAYITNLHILSPDGVTGISENDTPYFDLYQYAVDETGITDFETLAASYTPQLWVEVEVYDPATESTSTYTVHGSTDLEEACGISDLYWGQATDSTKYAIDANTGLVRMLYETSSSSVVIRISTHATKDGSALEDRAALRFATPETIDGEGEDEEGYVPSDTLTIMVYYEEYPADVNDPDDEYWLRLTEHNDATSVTYTQSELAAISSRDQAYTMIGDTKSCQAIATGVNFMLLLQDALGSNATIDDIAGFYFKTFDEGYMPGQYFVSASLLFQDRYFYPYYFDGGDRTAAQQVYPVLAWESKLYWSNHYSTSDLGDLSDSSNWNRADMSSQSRYRLIFGALPGSGFSTKNSVYCIQTVYVVLKGGPPISDGDGDDDDPSGSDHDSDSGDGSGGSQKGDEGDGSEGSGNAGKVPESGDPTIGDSQGQDASAEGAEAYAAATDQTQDGTNGEGTGTSRKQSVYQMINKNELSVVLSTENALGWVIIPLGLIALAAGVAYACLWFRRQTAPIPSGASARQAEQEAAPSTERN